MPDLLTLPIFLYPPSISKPDHPRLRCCVLPYVSSHPRPLSATIRGQVTVVLSTRPERGHDPSLGAPMLGITAPGPYRWSRASARRAPVTRSQTPKLLPPFIVTLRCAGYSPFRAARQMLVKQCLCLQAAPAAPVELATVLRQRVTTTTCRAHRFHSLSHETSHILSAHEQFDCYVQP